MAIKKIVLRTQRRAIPDWDEKKPSEVPASAQAALRKAMELENIPAIEFQDFLWIMAQESGGRVAAKNRHSTARGLFQLLQSNYNLNPNGINSFGNATEECQGGIRYIVGRYRSASTARRFWQAHHWY